MTPRFLDLLEVLEIHQSRIELYGGSHGVRELGLLQSAIAQPESSFGGQYLHADVFEMAAAYLFHIAKNHAFIDGNKRTALAACLVFLDLNEVEINASPEALEKLTIDTAVGAIDKPAIAAFLRQSSQPKESTDD